MAIIHPVALITGGAKRIGAYLVKTLHQQGFNIALHYRHSAAEAQALAFELNQLRPHSVLLLQADASDIDALQRFPEKVEQHLGRLDVLINNASSFYSTPIGTATVHDWNQLIDSNLKMAFFLSQATVPLLQQTASSSIINIIDVHATHPLPTYSLYGLGKAGLKALTEQLALELSPAIRVNAIAPGWILPDQILTCTQEKQRLSKIPLQRIGSLKAIADAVLYLISADYVTGITLTVDGGRHLM